MANKKLSQLTTAVSLNNTDIIPIVDNTGTKKITATTLKNYVTNGLATVATSGSYSDLTNKPTIPNLAAVAEHIIPATDVTYDLGSATNRFRDLYLSNNTIYLGSTAVSILDNGQLLLSELYQGGEGQGGISSIEWTTSTELLIRTEDTSGFIEKFDSLKKGDTFELVDGSDGSFPADTVLTVDGAVTKTLVQGGGYYDFVIPVDDAATSNVFVYTFNLKRPPLIDVNQLNDSSNLLGGGSGTTLPSNASGYLVNDGSGNLSWAAGDGTFSGNYNDLTNKPTIPTLVNADWNEIASESPAYIFNKPTIPTSTSNLSNDSGFITSNVSESIVPTTDNAIDLGSPTNRFRHLYVAPGTIYLGDIKLTNLNGKLDARKVINPGEENEEEDTGAQGGSDAFSTIREIAVDELTDTDINNPTNGQALIWDSNAEKWVNGTVGGSGSISVLDANDNETTNVNAIAFTGNATVTNPEPGLVSIEITGGSGGSGSLQYAYVVSPTSYPVVDWTVDSPTYSVTVTGDASNDIDTTNGGWGYVSYEATNTIRTVLGFSYDSGNNQTTITLNGLGDSDYDGAEFHGVRRLENFNTITGGYGALDIVDGDLYVTGTSNHINSQQYNVTVNENGVISMNTARGGIEFGAQPEVGGPQHLHIMRPAGQEGSTDLYFGDDFNYVKMPGLYGIGSQGVEIGSSYDGGSVNTWRFDTDGKLKLPVGGDIVDSNGTSVLGGSGGAGLGNLSVDGSTIESSDSAAYINFDADGGDNVLALGTNDGAHVKISTDGGATNFELTAANGAGGIKFPDGTVQTTAYVTAEQKGFFTEFTRPSDNNRVDMEAVAVDDAGNSYVSYSYYSDNDNRRFGGIAKLNSSGAVQWTKDITSPSGNPDYVKIASLEFVTIDGVGSFLTAYGYYYDNNTNRDVGLNYFLVPDTGDLNNSFSTELDVDYATELSDGVFGSENNGPVAVLAGNTYGANLEKSVTILSPSTTDRVYISWADYAAQGFNPGDQVYYYTGGYYGMTINRFEANASEDGLANWEGISIQVCVNKNGDNYTYGIIGTNGWGYLLNSWGQVNIKVLGSKLGGVDGVNDLTFDFDNTVFNSNSDNLQAAVSNIQGTPYSAAVVCQAWNGKDWSTEIGNTLTFEYQLNGQALLTKLGGSGNWTKNLGGTSYERFESVTVDSSNNIYAVGYYWKINKGSFVVKYNSAGVEQWAVHIDPTGNTGNTVYSVDMLSDGNIITVADGGIVTKINSSDGSIMWQIMNDDGPSWDSDFKGTATPDGNYIFANYEDNDYTMYVICVSGTDGSVVWTKQISRAWAGSNGEIYPQNDYNAQYIDCNSTHVVISATSEVYLNNNNNYSGLVFSLPIDGQGIDGTYGQYVIQTASLTWNTQSTTSTPVVVDIQTISADTTTVSPNTSNPDFTVTKTNIGGAAEPDTTIAEWTNPNNNTWSIHTYNGGAAVTYNGGDTDALWFDSANSPLGDSQFRGAIIEYHAFIGSQGTVIGTIHIAADYYNNGTVTHTESISGGSNANMCEFWYTDNNRRLYFRRMDGYSQSAMIQWTAKCFYGQEYDC